MASAFWVNLGFSILAILGINSLYIFHLHWNPGIGFTMSTVISLVFRIVEETVSLRLMIFFYSKELAKCISTWIAIYGCASSTLCFVYLLADFLALIDSSKYT